MHHAGTILKDNLMNKFYDNQTNNRRNVSIHYRFMFQDYLLKNALAPGSIFHGKQEGASQALLELLAQRQPEN